MGIRIMMLLSDLLIPVTMLVFGRIFTASPPKDINAWYGYRTRRSMSSPEAWDFAHRYAGRIWSRLGLVTLVLTVGATVLLFGQSDDTVSWAGMAVMLLQLAPMTAVFPQTERALKKAFDENGDPTELE